MKKLSLLVLAPTLLALASCGGGETPASSKELPSSVASTKEAVEVLKNNPSFRMNFEILDKDGLPTESYYRYYTPTYVYDKDPVESWGYAVKDNKVVEIVNIDGEDRLGYYDETKSASNLYDGTFSWFGSFNTSLDFKDGETTTDIKAKANKLALLGMFNLDAAYVVYAKDCCISIPEDGSINGTYGYININDVWWASFTVEEFGNAKDSNLENALKDAAYENSDEETIMYDLFMDNNYQRNCYDQDGTYIGAEHFLPRYFYGEYTDEYIQKQIAAGGLAYSYGLMGLDNVTLGGTTYNGSYWFTIANNQVSMITTNPYNVNPDVTAKDVYNYPSNMLIWKRLYMFDFDGVDKYVTRRQDIITDFAINFQIMESLNSYGAELISLTMKPSDLLGDAKIAFTIRYKTNSGTFNTTYEFDHFGTANMTIADKFLAEIDELKK